MHLEYDYTNGDSEKDLTIEQIGKEKDIYNCSSKEDLEIFLEYCRTRDTQFDIRPSQSKRKQLFECYEQLKKMAFIHNGKIILDIAENIMKAKLTYWSKCLVLYCDKSVDSKNILLELLKGFEIIYIEEYAGGIQICAEENLFDEIQIKNENNTLLKLRQSMGKTEKVKFKE